MSKIFACDRCGQQFGGPLDEEKFTDENGNVRTFDLCAPCRKILSETKDKANQKFFQDIVAGGNNG